MKAHASFNRCYRLLWSCATQQWKPVPETARTAKKGGRSSAADTLTLAGVLPSVAMSLFVLSNVAAQPPPAATQLPTGGTVVGGQATISQSAIATAANMVVNQSSQRAIIDWSNFNLGSAATVQFVQPNARSVILNRVLDANPTQIYGRINANGQVFITNPYGVYFSPSAIVDVGGLVATTYDIRNRDFMSGFYRFDSSGVLGRIVNEGTLRASAGGYIALLAPEVQNSGVVLARAGTVAMASGDQITLTMSDGKSLSGLTTTPSTLASLIDNQLAVQAPDGQIILSSVAVNKLQGGVIKNSGRLAATSLTAKGGKIVLEGDDIQLAATAVVDVSGRQGGGTVLMGGDWQGSGGLRQATQVSMAQGATIHASATDRGNGGKVVLWSNVNDANSQTSVHGSIQANAGPNGGNGGQIETSGHDLNVDGIQIATRAPQGKMGEWLLDPANINITNGGSDVNISNASGTFSPNSSAATSNISSVTLSNALNSTNVTVTTVNNGSDGVGAGNINISGAINWSNATTLTLIANDSISGLGSLGMTGGGSVVFNNSNASSTSLYTGLISGNGSVIKQGAGTITFTANNTYTGNTTVSAGVLAFHSYSNSSATLDGNGNYTFAASAIGAGAVKVQDGGTLKIGMNTNMANYLELQGAGASGQAGALVLGVNTIIYGKTLLKASGTVIGGGGGSARLLGDILDEGQSRGLTINVTGNIGLYDSKSYSGTTNITGAASTILASSNMSNSATFNTSYNVSSGSQLAVWAPTGVGTELNISGDINGAGNLLVVSWASNTRGNTTLMGQLNLTGTTNISSNGSLTLKNSNDYTFTSNFTGANGSLTASGSNLTFAGNGTTYTGNLTINAGKSVTIGDGGTNGSLNVSYVTDNGNLTFNRSDDVSFRACISGSGTVNKVGSNVLTLSGNSTFTGNITVRAGTLKAGVSGNSTVGAFGNKTNVTLVDVTGVGLDISGGSTSIGSLSGGANNTLNLGGSTLTTGLNGLSTTYAGAVLGSGTLSQSGAGTFTLSGNSSSFTGGVNVYSGTLAVTNSTVLGNGTPIVSVYANATLDLQNTANWTNKANISANGTLAVSTGNSTMSGTLIASTNPNFINISQGSSLTSTGTITENTINKYGLGTWIVAEPAVSNVTQSLSTLNISAGRVELNSTKWKLGSVTQTIAANATLSVGTFSLNSFGTNTSGAITNNGLLQVGGMCTTANTFWAAVSGTGSVEYRGTAQTTIQGTQSYTGTTTIFPNASLRVFWQTSSLGNVNQTIINNGNLTLTTGSNVDWSQSITGPGNLTVVTDDGITQRTLGIKSANSYTGTTTIGNNTTLQLGGLITKTSTATLGTGDIILQGANSTLCITRTSDLTLTNNISGPGNLSLDNINLTTTIAGNANIGGSINLRPSNIILRIAPTGSLGSNGVYAGTINFMSSNITLDYASASDLCITGLLNQSGSTGGKLLKTVSNSNLTLTTSNNISGGVWIEAGTVYVLGNSTATGKLGAGNVSNNATLVFNNSGALGVNLSDLSGNISGTGNVTFIATGNATINKTINLSGANSLIKVQSLANVSVKSNLTASGANGKIILIAGANTAAGTSTGGQIDINSTVNLTLNNTGTVALFQGDNTSNLTSTLEARIVGATTAGVKKYKTYNASLSSLSSAVIGTRNYYYRLRPTATLTGGTVTAAKVYDGTTVANATYTGNGSMAGVDGDSLTGAVLSASYNTSSAGNKSLNVTLAIASSNANWSVSGYNGTISGATTTATITKAPLTIQANDDARFVTFSDTPGYTGASYSGFVNNETVATALTGTLAITRNSGSGAGTYTLTPSGQSAANYNITYRTGVYTIVPAQELLVRVSDGTSIYGNTLNLTVASATYLMPDNTTVVNLTGNLSVNGAGLYTLQDGASGSASFNLGLSNATLSSSNNAVVDVWNVGYSNLTRVGVNFNNMTVVGTQTITPRSLNVTAAASNKVYDGNTTAVVTLANNRVSNDVVNITADATGVFTDRNAADGKTVTISNIAMSGTDARNYVLSSNVVTTTANITKKTLTLTGPSASDKVYDATTIASVAFTGYSGLLGIDDVQVASSGTFSDKNVGSNKTVTVTALALSGQDAGNYQLSNAVTTANITPKALTVSGLSAVTTKVYDGTDVASPLGTASLLAAEAAGAGHTTDGQAYSGDAVSITGTPTATYNSKDVATAVNVSFGGITLTGAQAGNYVLTTPSPIAANITPAPLIVRANDDARFVTQSDAAGFAGASYSGFVHNENATTAGLGGTLNISRADTNNAAANYTLTASGLTSTNYNITFQNGTYTILPADAMLIRVRDGSSVYGSAANLTVANISYLMPDNVTIVDLTSNLTSSNGLYSVQDGANGSASFNLALSNPTLSRSGNVSVGIWHVGYSNLTQSGLNFNTAVAVGTQTVTAKALTVAASAANKVYDGNTNVTLTLNSSDAISGDDISFAYSNASFANKNAGINKTASAINITLSGADASNYVLQNVVANATANITARTLTITGITAADKVYDGTNNATTNLSGVTNAALVSGGMLADDNVVVAATGTFADKHVGTAKEVTLNSTYSGADADNYIITSQANTTANITAKTLTITGITANNKVYDGSANATLNTSAVNSTSMVAMGLVAGDDLSLTATGMFADKHVNTAKVVTLNTTYSGNDAGNYNITSQTNTTADITAKALTITGLSANNKVYDGTLNATINTSGVNSTSMVGMGLVAGDNVTILSAGTFADKNVNTSKVVTINSIFGGADAGNYLISSQASSTADITQKTLTITGITAADKVYDGTTTVVINTAAVNSTSLVTMGLVAGDSLTVSATGSFADKHAQDAKVVTLSSSYTGADLANYNITSQANTTANITAKALTITGITAANKVYDGTVNATVNTSAVNSTSLVGMGLIAGDDLTLAVTGTFADKNANTSKVVTLNATYGGNDAGNYNITSQANTTADITPKALTLTGLTAAASKVYDGTTVAAPLGSAELLNVSAPGAGTSNDGKAYSGDALTLSGAPTATYNSKDVATAANVSFGGLTLTGAAAGNYVLSAPTPVAATITPASLVVRANDDARFVTLSDTAGYAGASYNGFVNNENVTTAGLNGALSITRNNASAAVGNYTLTASGLTSSNYNVTYQTGTYTIVPAETLLVRTRNDSTVYGTAASLQVTSAQYLMSDNVTIVDLTNNVTLNNGSYSVQDGVGTSANFTLAMTEATRSQSGQVSAGIWSVGYSDFSRVGSSFNSLAAVGTHTVTAKALTVSATGNHRAYDGTTNTSVTLSSTDVISGDNVSYGYSSTSFTDKNVGTNKIVSVSNVSLSGGDASNYQLQNRVANTTANITARAIDLTGSRAYDGTTQIASSAMTMNNLVAGETLNLSGAGTVASANVAAGNQSLNLGTLAVADGNALASNYDLSAGTHTASITAKSVTIAAPQATRVYDGSVVYTANSTELAALSALLGVTGETVSAITLNYDNKHAGTGKTLVASDVVVRNASNAVGTSNYNITYADNNASVITAKAVTLPAPQASRAYDGTTQYSANATQLAALTAALGVAGDSVSHITLAYDNKDPGTGKTLTATHASIEDGNNGLNYNVSYADNTASVITGAAPTASVPPTHDSGAVLASVVRPPPPVVPAPVVTTAPIILPMQRVGTMSVQQIRKLTADQLLAIDPDELSGLSPLQQAAFTPEQRAVMTTSQIAALNLTTTPEEAPSDNEFLTSQKALALVTQTNAPTVQAERPLDPVVVAAAPMTAQPFTPTPQPTSAPTSGVVPVTVLGDNRISNMGMAFEQQPNDIHVQLTSAPTTQPDVPSTLVRFTGNFKTFMVSDERGEMVSYQGAMIGKRMVILADTESAKRLARKEMQTVLAAAITTLGSDQAITLAQVESVVLDLR